MFNHAKSSGLSEQHGMCTVSNVINFLSGEAGTQNGVCLRLLTCQNQTIANVSPVQITFTIGCHL